MTVGDAARYIGMSITGKQVIHFDATEDAGAYLCTMAQEGDTVLIKASRGMQLEQIATMLQER